MLTFPNSGRLVQTVDELPDLKGARDVYVDFETTSNDPKKTSLYPWRDCSIAGIGITVDDVKGAWYIPVGHRHDNLPKDLVLAWLQEIFDTCDRWINHNVKYDALVAHVEGMRVPNTLVCTLTLAKLLDSDRYGNSLTQLSQDWLGHDIVKYEDRLQAYLNGCNSKDYGDVPVDIIGEYGCQDALTVRDLWRHIDAQLHKECYDVRDTEIALTGCLLDLEIEGLYIDATELKAKQLVALTKMVLIEEKLHGLCEQALRPHVNADCYDFLCNKYGLPILGYTDEGNPSFDKDTLQSYLRHPIIMESELLTQAVKLMLAYRKLNTLNTLFLNKFIELNINGILHGSYNQSVRTARMSSKMPNQQQNSYESKLLLHPKPGYAFISADYSQIEFRIIVHYIQDADCIAAYAADPDTDFHTWVAEMCGIARSPAKNVNFCIAFGGGRGRVLSMLASNMELVGTLMSRVDEMIAAGKWTDSDRTALFNALAKRRAEQVFEQYHSTLPGLRRTSRSAETVLKKRGHVKNIRNRHRHLPLKAAFRAFNSIIQSSAAEIMKERLVAISARNDKQMREWGITHVACVHDELLFQAPIAIARDPKVLKHIADVLENPSVSLRVPLRVNIGVSENNWAEASKNSLERSYFEAT